MKVDVDDEDFVERIVNCTPMLNMVVLQNKDVLRMRFDDGDSLLIAAAENTPLERVEETIRVLIARGANVNSKNDRGRTLLMVLATQIEDAHYEPNKAMFLRILKSVVAAGANVRAKDDDGRRCIDIRFQYRPARDYLVEAGAGRF